MPVKTGIHLVPLLDTYIWMDSRLRGNDVMIYLIVLFYSRGDSIRPCALHQHCPYLSGCFAQIPNWIPACMRMSG